MICQIIDELESVEAHFARRTNRPNPIAELHERRAPSTQLACLDRSRATDA